MKLVVYGLGKRVGAVKDNSVIDLSAAYAKYLHEAKGETRADELAAALVPSDLARLIEGGRHALDEAQKALDHLAHAANQNAVNGARLVHAANAVKIHAPRPNGTRMACAGSNFTSHRERMTVRSGREIRAPFIWGFWKVSDPIGPEEDMIYPTRCDRLDYEGELAIILGKGGKDLKPNQLKDFVWGVTLFCDWSIRSPREPLGPMNFAAPKNFDTSYSLGPCIVVDEADCTNVDIETFVNGERRQAHNTKEMTFSFGQYLEYLSRDLTLKPGDLICSGTGEGTAADSSPTNADGSQPPDKFLKIGDKVEIKSPQVGSLKATIVAKNK
ncbi:MAG TPA: fumarylacetoacetate hydrolase family protein [Stellaceae bacterium]|jgi:2-keto-4-pentenoate hydratase/2-oxohepta-3-ene-1,7-dioic acid hydratase in catechol pathway|nr:fumarylacetoacetate hydrolase family protein [Stellaceae bacterium]